MAASGIARGPAGLPLCECVAVAPAISSTNVSSRPQLQTCFLSAYAPDMLKAAAFLFFALAEPAHAVCTTATLADDYQQADLVVRAIVTAETRAADDEPSIAFRKRWGDYSPVTLHRLRVVEAFKGKPGPTISLFETVDSGRFGAELGDEYLIFLSYYPPAKFRPATARGATFVRHTCGQSKNWKKVSSSEIARLRALNLKR
jgi:hypothetical protein